jgi:hypothetical protein
MKKNQTIVSELLDTLKDVAQTLAWLSYGECRGFSEGLLSTNDALDKAKSTIEKVTGEKA